MAYVQLIFDSQLYMYKPLVVPASSQKGTLFDQPCLASVWQRSPVAHVSGDSVCSHRKQTLEETSFHSFFHSSPVFELLHLLLLITAFAMILAKLS